MPDLTARNCLNAMITRFAPSPTGALHRGNAFSALYTEQAARTNNGRFLLRIEDIDRSRCRPEFEQMIYDDLAWLGLKWEEPVRRQSEHFSTYDAAVARLTSRGLTYPCFCTRKEIAAEIAASPSAPHGPDGPLYPGTCRGLSATERRTQLNTGKAYAVRLDLQAALLELSVKKLGWQECSEGWITAQPQLFGDVVLARKDIPCSYHLAVTVDDAEQQITLVTRGKDLQPATHIHVLLQALLDLPTPDYDHHRLILDADGRRLAKRKGDHALNYHRLRGVPPALIRQQLGFPADCS